MNGGTVHDMAANGIDQRREQRRRLADPVGQSGALKIDAFPGIDLRLAVKRQMIRILRDQDMGQKTRPRPPVLDRQHRSGNLQDTVTMTTGKLRSHCADDLEPRRDVFQGLGNIVTDLPQPTATLMAGVARAENHLFARQMVRQGLPLRLGLG